VQVEPDVTDVDGPVAGGSEQFRRGSRRGSRRGRRSRLAQKAAGRARAKADQTEDQEDAQPERTLHAEILRGWEEVRRVVIPPTESFDRQPWWYREWIDAFQGSAQPPAASLPLGDRYNNRTPTRPRHSTADWTLAAMWTPEILERLAANLAASLPPLPEADWAAIKQQAAAIRDELRRLDELPLESVEAMLLEPPAR
jgi:hypothetical protein